MDEFACDRCDAAGFGSDLLGRHCPVCHDGVVVQQDEQRGLQVRQAGGVLTIVLARRPDKSFARCWEELKRYAECE